MSDSGVEEKPAVIAPQTSSLEAWAAKPWTDGVQISELEKGDVLTIETKHHRYEMKVINPAMSLVLLSGGDLFPEPRVAYVSGASMRSSLLKMGGIYPGFCIELVVDDKRITTSRVQSVHRQMASEFEPLPQSLIS